jgi:hypothetical protein
VKVGVVIEPRPGAVEAAAQVGRVKRLRAHRNVGITTLIGITRRLG